MKITQIRVLKTELIKTTAISHILLSFSFFFSLIVNEKEGKIGATGYEHFYLKKENNIGTTVLLYYFLGTTTLFLKERRFGVEKNNIGHLTRPIVQA